MATRKRIAFQGEPGANSDLACRKAYRDYEPLPRPTFEDVFTALVERDRAQSGTAESAANPQPEQAA